eukprot:scaffold433783_cov38-Prasinocladus_malaysianus.AAC.1
MCLVLPDARPEGAGGRRQHLHASLRHVGCSLHPVAPQLEPQPSAVWQQDGQACADAVLHHGKCIARDHV